MRISKLLLGLALLLVLVLLPQSMTPAQAADAPVQSYNMGYRYSSYWADPVESQLVQNSDGSFTRVEYINKQVVIEKYNSKLQFVSGTTLKPELPVFGGFYYGSDANYLIFGQNNLQESNSCEVIRVVKYDRSWKRLGATSVYGSNTYIPFDAGSLRCAEYNGVLAIHTAHEMYAKSDGLHHQANMTLWINTATMKLIESGHEVSYSYAYCSHSFNQFIIADGGKFVTVDHGDAYPRSVCINRYNSPIQTSQLDTGNWGRVELLRIAGSTGANATGVCVGGLSASSTSYLVAGTTIDHATAVFYSDQRNVFLTVTSKTNFTSSGTQIRYLTNFTDSDQVTLSNVYLVKINDNKFAVLWNQTDSDNITTLQWAFVDANGQLLGSVYSGYGSLSECPPILAGNRLIWYVTNHSAPNFHYIDLAKPDTATHTHVKTYAYQETKVWLSDTCYRVEYAYPTATTAGRVVGKCNFCDGFNQSITVPAVLGSKEFAVDTVYLEATCNRIGRTRYRWSKGAQYGLDKVTFLVDMPALGHQYTNGKCERCMSWQPNYSGLMKHYDVWFCMKSGNINWDYTGLYKWNGEWWYIFHGEMASRTTTLVKYSGSWWYVVNGKLAAKTTSLVKFNGEWFYVVNGKVASTTTSMIKYNNEWWYVVKGKVASKTTTLVNYNGGWYYIVKGKLAAKTTTLVKYCGRWYYVRNGAVDWKYTGSVAYSGKTYKVKNGRVI